MRVEVREKIVEKRTHEIQYLDRIIETPAPKTSPAEAVAIVLASPRACRSLLDALTDEARSGALARGENSPTVRAAGHLLVALMDQNLVAPPIERSAIRRG